MLIKMLIKSSVESNKVKGQTLIIWKSVEMIETNVATFRY